MLVWGCVQHIWNWLKEVHSSDPVGGWTTLKRHTDKVSGLAPGVRSAWVVECNPPQWTPLWDFGLHSIGAGE